MLNLPAFHEKATAADSDSQNGNAEHTIVIEFQRFKALNMASDQEAIRPPIKDR